VELAVEKTNWELADITELPLKTMGFGENVAVTPAGNPIAFKLMSQLPLPDLVTVTTFVVLLPGKIGSGDCGPTATEVRTGAANSFAVEAITRMPKNVFFGVFPKFCE
jgi:hypothetical protein